MFPVYLTIEIKIDEFIVIEIVIHYPTWYVRTSSAMYNDLKNVNYANIHRGCNV